MLDMKEKTYMVVLLCLTYVMLQCNTHEKNSPVIEACVSVTLHVRWSSIPCNSLGTSKSTSIHSCRQHTFEHFLFMIVTLCCLFSAFSFTVRDVIAEVKSPVPVCCMTAVPALPVFCMTVDEAFLPPPKF